MKALTLLVKPAAGLCNMDCGYCFYKAASENRENRIMTRETADLLIQRIEEYRPDELSVIFQGGEPTLAGLDYFEYFAKNLKRRVKAYILFSIQTNGLLIDNRFASFLKKYDFLVGVSVDGSRKTNDRYRVDRNGYGVLPQTLTAISILKKHGVNFNILSVIDSKNAGDADSTYAYFKKHKFYDLQFIPYVDDREGINLSCEAYENFLKRIFDLWYDDFTAGEMIQIRHINNYLDIIAGFPPESCAMCGICGNYFVIESNGDIYPCDFYCDNEHLLGSIYGDNPFGENEIKSRFIEQSLIIHSHCKSCKYYSLCRGGCRRDRIDNLTVNKYCKAYYNFFEYSIERLTDAVRRLENG